MLLICGSLGAQRPHDELGAVPARPVPTEAAMKIKKSAVTVTLPFFDDFSYDSHRPADTLWVDDQVYINQTMGTSPPSIGVATFDGLDRWGLPYDIDKLSQDTTDVLTSQPIDLSSPLDSVYLSFFWQAGGYGEQPESNDALQLQFYNPQSNIWSDVWSISGVDSSDFVQQMVAVPDSFFQDSFQFRFRSFGTPAGAFDTWNLDYVRLDDQRTFADTLPPYEDPAFTRPHPSLLKNYESIPWFHYTSAVADNYNEDNLTFHYQRNTLESPPFIPAPYSLDLGIYRITHNGNVLASSNGSGTFDDGHGYFEEIAYNILPAPFKIPNLPMAQEFTINAFQTFDGLNTLVGAQNDTVRRNQVFSNYYAYDDGTAERAYQVGDNGGGIIVSRYEMLTTGNPQTDSIKGLYIYFLPAEFDATENEFTIVIYADNNGLPGNLIYETDSVYTPQLSQTNFYMPYPLDSAILGSGTVYMGIRQLKNQRLPIGFDRNNVGRTTTFYGTIGPGGNISNLFESFRKGTVMMRPYLNYQPADLGIEPIAEKEKLEVDFYPNPARDEIHFDYDPTKEFSYSLMDLGGKLLQSGPLESTIHLEGSLSNGVYLLRITDASGQKAPLVAKVLITR